MCNIEGTAHIRTLMRHEKESHSDEGKVCSAVLSVQRQDAGVCEDVLIAVSHSLEIANE